MSLKNKKAQHKKETPRFKKSKLITCIRNQSNLPGSLDCNCQLALVGRTCPRDPSRNDLSSIAHILSQLRNIFIIYFLNLINAKSTDFPAPFSWPIHRHKISPFPKKIYKIKKP